MENNKKNNKGLIVLVIFLIVLVVVLSGFIVCDKLNTRKETKEVVKKVQNKENIESKILSKSELTMYVSYVPSSSSYGYMVSDAYSNQKADVNDIIYINTFDNTNKTTERPNSSSYKKDTNGSETYNDILLDSCVEKKEFESNLTKMYNLKLNKSEFMSSNGTAYVDGNYICSTNGRGLGLGFKKISNIEKYELDKEKLYIYENVGFLDNNGDNWSLYTNTFNSNESSQNNNFKISDVSIEDSSDEKSLYEKYNSKFKIFKHTFNKNSNGDYYWYSTEEYNK